MTEELERVLQEAADIADDRGHDYLGVEHVALAIIADAESTSRCHELGFTLAQWRRTLLDRMPKRPAPRPKRRRRTDLFYWHTTEPA